VVRGQPLSKPLRCLASPGLPCPELQARFRESVQAGASPPRWGGRRRSLMTFDEEQAFLAPWAEHAKAGSILVVSVIRAALAQRLGRPVKPSVVYRLLERHGWRKVAPDTHHPKSNPAAQEDWKKTPRDAGCLADTRRGQRASSSVDVSR
jgi:transposase